MSPNGFSKYFSLAAQPSLTLDKDYQDEEKGKMDKGNNKIKECQEMCHLVAQWGQLMIQDYCLEGV